MKVSEVKYKKTCGDIIIAGQTYEGLSLESLYSYGVKKDAEIDESTLAELLKDSEKRRCKEKALSLIGIKSRTEKELRIKLYEKGFSSEAVRYAMELVKGYGYISDKDFAERFAQSGSEFKGAYRIKRELMMKGIDESIANSAVEEACQNEGEIAKAVAEKYMRGRTLDLKTKEKLFRHLLSHGFSYECTKSATLGFDFGTSPEEEDYDD